MLLSFTDKKIFNALISYHETQMDINSLIKMHKDVEIMKNIF